MAITRRQVLGDVVTAYEVHPDSTRASSDHELATPDAATARALFERIMHESDRLAQQIRLEKNGTGNA